MNQLERKWQDIEEFGLFELLETMKTKLEQSKFGPYVDIFWSDMEQTQEAQREHGRPVPQ